jgi:hypothetical protein
LKRESPAFITKGLPNVSTPPESFSSEEDQSTEAEQQERLTESTEEQTSPGQTEEPSKEQSRYTHSTLPPEEQGETHGGPLGCCLGTIIGIFLFSLLIVLGSLALSNGGFLGAATLPVVLLGGTIGGFIGWRIGQKIYRVYEPPEVIIERHKGRQRVKVKRG